MSIQPGILFEKKGLFIERAIISVYDKTGLPELAVQLHKRGVKIYSTGGSARVIRQQGVPVTDISEITGFPEMLDGRLKTLHPRVHGGLLARPNYSKDKDELDKNNISPIQLLVVNLYPFVQVVQNEVTVEVAMENIDIGGPAMIRSAAKNVDHVCVLTDPDMYMEFIDELDDKNMVSYDFRLKQARRAFSRSSAYDAAISEYLSGSFETGFPDTFRLQLSKNSVLRYGENPHQAAAVYGNQQEVINCIHGKQLSYNNYMDVDAALQVIRDFYNESPAVAIIKHTQPCGVAVADDLMNAWHHAFTTDTSSPFGGIVAVNRELDAETAIEIDKIFTEIIVAPSFSAEALEILKKKSNRRLVILKNPDFITGKYVVRSVFGGLLCQQPDTVVPDERNFRVVTRVKPTEAQMSDMIFAWKVVKRVNSNAIVYARDKHTLGIGSGQPSRVDASEIAVNKAAKFGLSLKDSVVASDAFFPFPDGVEMAAEAGAKAVIQPGGSIRDEEVIKAANDNGITMIFTGMRHFKH